MDAYFCLAALEEAINRYGVPEIFNRDQGSQFTSLERIQALTDGGVAISVDGKDCWMDSDDRTSLVVSQMGVFLFAGSGNRHPTH